MNNPNVDDLAQPHEIIESDKSQISMAKLFFWVALAGFVTASVMAYVEYFDRSMQGPNLFGVRQTIIVTITWLLLLVHYVQERSYGAIAVHALTPLIVAIFMLLFIEFDAGSFTILLVTCIFSSVFGILLGVESIVSKTVNKNSKPQIYLCYRVLGGMVLLSFFCGIVPSLLRGWIDFPSVIMGALIGFWIGFYQAMATCDWVRNIRVAGVGTRPIATVGLLGAVAGPFIFSLINKNWTSVSYIPFQYGPLLAFVLAAATIVLWRILFRATSDKALS